MKYKTYLLFGAPGSGKGTQGKILGSVPGFVHVASGDLFRSLDPNSALGKIFRQYSDRGQLVPDDFTVRLWGDHIDRLIKSKRFNPEVDYLVLDGIPRNVRQAEMLSPHLDVRKLIHLSAQSIRQEVTHRLKLRALKESRNDDINETVIRQRMEVFESETMPLLRYYPASVHANINAVQSPLKVAHDIFSAILADDATPPGRNG